MHQDSSGLYEMQLSPPLLSLGDKTEVQRSFLGVYFSQRLYYKGWLSKGILQLPDHFIEDTKLLHYFVFFYL